MNLKSLKLLGALTLVAPIPARAQFGPPASGFTMENPVLRRMWAMGMDSSMASRYGQVLLDSIGPRLVGTPQMNSAADYVVSVYQSLGIEARKENYGTWRGWRRGRSHLDLVQPRVRSLEAMMLAWSPPTPGNRPVRGPVVVLPEAGDSAAFRAWLPGVRGKFVAISFPQPTCRPDSSWAEHAQRATFDRMRAQRDTAQREYAQRVQRLGGAGGLSNANLARLLDSAGAHGILTSNWSQGWGVNKIFSAITRRTPVFDVSCEDYGLLHRLASNNQGPVVEMLAEAEFLGEVPAFNVIGTIPGQLANEYVMLSAHFDSWDGASGATDNGTGTLVMLEAMRLLRAAYPNPRRTIIVGHWGAEEMGLVGSRAFAADHRDVVEGLQALFNQDNGTGRVRNMSPAGLFLAAGNLARYLAQIPSDLTRDIAFTMPGSPAGGGSDNASFICSGAPGFGLGSGSWDYGVYTWHTNRDTYDKISWDDVKMNATLTAMLAYLASEDPERMPRDRRTVMPRGQGGNPTTWPACQDAPRTSPQVLTR